MCMTSDYAWYMMGMLHVLDIDDRGNSARLCGRKPRLLDTAGHLEVLTQRAAATTPFPPRS